MVFGCLHDTFGAKLHLEHSAYSKRGALNGVKGVLLNNVCNLVTFIRGRWGRWLFSLTDK